MRKYSKQTQQKNHSSSCCRLEFFTETSSCLLSFSVLSLEESVKAMSLSAEEDDIPWDNMRDNRDLTVFTSWDPKDR